MKQYKICYWRTFVIRKCNIVRYLVTFCWSMIMMMKWLCAYWPTINKETSLNEQMKVIQEVVSPEVSKLNHAVTNKNQRDQMQFSLEKRLKKRKCIHPTHHTWRWIVLQNGVFDSSILMEIFFICLKMFIMQQRKNSLDEIKRMSSKNW